MARVRSKYENGRLRFYSGAVDFSMTSQSSAGATMNNYGLSIISSTVVNTLSAPTSGAIKDLLFYNTTKQMVIKTTGALFNSITNLDVMTVDLSSAYLKEIGLPVRLVGSGTTAWWVMAPALMNTTAHNKVIDLTNTT